MPLDKRVLEQAILRSGIKIDLEDLALAARQSPLVEWMIENEIPLTREDFISINTPDEDPSDLPGELESAIPFIFEKEE